MIKQFDQIFIGTDHNGFVIKEDIIKYLSKNYQVTDLSNQEFDPDDDFTDFATRAVTEVLTRDRAMAILICGSGQGMVMAANRFKGIRAGLAYNPTQAEMIRKDEDANVCCLSARELEGKPELWQPIIDQFLMTEFLKAPRFNRRNHKLDQLG